MLQVLQPVTCLPSAACAAVIGLMPPFYYFSSHSLNALDCRCRSTDHSYKNGCQACNSDGKRCSSCLEGYRLDELTGKCNACKDVLCARCSADLSSCLECMTAPPWAESDWDYGPIFKNAQGKCTEVSWQRQ